MAFKDWELRYLKANTLCACSKGFSSVCGPQTALASESTRIALVFSSSQLGQCCSKPEQQRAHDYPKPETLSTSSTDF